MSGRMNYQAAKRASRLRQALRGAPPQENLPGHPGTSLRGWRLTDGRDHPVTVTSIRSSKENDDDRAA